MIFLHYWGVGFASKLADGVKAARDAQQLAQKPPEKSGSLRRRQQGRARPGALRGAAASASAGEKRYVDMSDLSHGQSRACALGPITTIRSMSR